MIVIKRKEYFVCSWNVEPEIVEARSTDEAIIKYCGENMRISRLNGDYREIATHFVCEATEDLTKELEKIEGITCKADHIAFHESSHCFTALEK